MSVMANNTRNGKRKLTLAGLYLRLALANLRIGNRAKAVSLLNKAGIYVQ